MKHESYLFVCEFSKLVSIIGILSLAFFEVAACKGEQNTHDEITITGVKRVKISPANQSDNIDFYTLVENISRARNVDKGDISIFRSCDSPTIFYDAESSEQRRVRVTAKSSVCPSVEIHLIRGDSPL